MWIISAGVWRGRGPEVAAERLRLHRSWPEPTDHSPSCWTMVPGGCREGGLPHRAPFRGSLKMAPDSEQCLGFQGPVWNPVMVSEPFWVMGSLQAYSRGLGRGIWGSFSWKIWLKTLFSVAQCKKVLVNLEHSLWYEGTLICSHPLAPQGCTFHAP